MYVSDTDIVIFVHLQIREILQYIFSQYLIIQKNVQIFCMTIFTTNEARKDLTFFRVVLRVT